MARYSEDPVRHIVTFRVNSEEKKTLAQLAEKSGRSLSCFMRKNLQLISEKECSQG
jgi:predicted transcriptional regulator